jgi:hypothetical protein
MTSWAIRRNGLIATVIALQAITSQAAEAVFAAVLRAPEETSYERLAPLLNHLEKMDLNEIQYLISEDDKISVELKSDEPVRPINRLATIRYIIKAGADEVTFSSADDFPWQPFTIEEFEQSRKNGKPILLFVRADWSLASLKLSRELFVDEDVIRVARQADFTALRVDLTERPRDEVMTYLKQLQAHGTPTVMVFPVADEPKARYLHDNATREQILEILEHFPKRETAKGE